MCFNVCCSTLRPYLVKGLIKRPSVKDGGGWLIENNEFLKEASCGSGSWAPWGNRSLEVYIPCRVNHLEMDSSRKERVTHLG